MKIGIFTALFGDKSLDETIKLVNSAGIEAVELGVGAYPGTGHVPVHELLSSESARREFLAKIADAGLIVSALSVHGNPIHPNSEIAAAHHESFRLGVEVAAKLGIEVVNGFSGCPGDHPNAVNPNWITCAWPDEFRDMLDWQWNEVVIPYWTEQAAFLAQQQVKFAIEMHPGFIVYNNEGLFRLREAVGANGKWLGVNFDPSHLWWQGIDPIAAAKQLCDADALFHVHAKDTRIDAQNMALNGGLDTKSYGRISERSWVFRSVGYGHSVEWWKDFCSVLRAHGYDHVLSIEHEDGLMTSMEGLRKAVAVLKEAVIAEEAGPMFWARD